METLLAVTKYLEPTNTKGARIRVRVGNSINKIVPFDYSASNANRAAVAAVLAMSYNDVRYAGMDDHYLITTTAKKQASK